MADCIHHCRLHRRSGADGAGLANALGTERVAWRWCLHRHQFDSWRLHCGDECILREVARFRVAVFVVHELFEQCLSRALGNATVNLSFQQQRIQHRAGVVTCHLLQVRDLARFGVHFHHGDMGTEWERGSTGGETLGDCQAAFARTTRRQLAPGHRHCRCTGNVECAA